MMAMSVLAHVAIPAVYCPGFFPVSSTAANFLPSISIDHGSPRSTSAKSARQIPTSLHKTETGAVSNTSDRLSGAATPSSGSGSGSGSAMSALRRLQQSLSERKAGRAPSSSASSASASAASSSTSSCGTNGPRLSRTRSCVSIKAACVWSGGPGRLFGRITRRSRSHQELNGGDEEYPGAGAERAARLRRHVSFADQPELARERTEARTARSPAPELAPPMPPSTVEEDSSGSDADDEEDDGSLASEDASLLRKHRGAEDHLMHERSEWQRSSDEYYALAFPWY